jgi:hexosaminidase
MTKIAIIPKPQHLEMGEGQFIINADTIIVTSEQAIAKLVVSYLQPATGFELKIQAESEAESNIITLGLSDEASDNPEGYQLTVTNDKITLQAPQATGLFFGIQTLRQLLPAQIVGDELAENVEWAIPAVAISDGPKFTWRGLHLDVARHMYPVEFIKEFIDMMVLYKYNIFHWHLTEDQGWRIEIKKHPKLTEIGAYRAETPIPENREQGDGKPYGGFYTQDEVREVVAYATERYITVVPEIEMPGHSVAVLAAYPELGCVGEGYQVRTKWGIAKDVLCAGKDSSLELMEDVLSEVLDLFPSEFIHIGGDECPKDRWEVCPDCQARIKTEGLDDEHGLQSWFIRRIETWLNNHGRRLIGWDEILEGGLAPNATVMSWRGSQGGIDAANAGHDVVMSPNTYCYLDYYQGEDLDSEPAAIGNYLPLKHAYQFEVIPADIDPDKAHHILGGQGNIWTEYMPTSEQVEYMTYPRSLAIAEVVWTHPEDRDYDQFEQRLKQHLPHLDAMNINYRPLGD